MTHHRSARLNEQFKREISQILARKVRDPRIGRVLVTEARVTPDLWLARVFVRPMDDEVDLESTLSGLSAAAPFIRKELGAVLRIRRIPELRFLHDTTLDSALRIEEILKDVLSEDGPGEGEVPSEAPEGQTPSESPHGLSEPPEGERPE